MGKNNPAYALQTTMLDMKTRNEAGAQAMRIFRLVTERYPSCADGWFWLGIALTETLRYTKIIRMAYEAHTPAMTTEGVRAFRAAYDSKPDDLIFATYYGEALMAYCEEFDTALAFWNSIIVSRKRICSA